MLIGEVNRGMSDLVGTRLIPEVWASPAFPEFLRKTGIAAYWDEFGAPEQGRKADNGNYLCK